MSDEMNWSVAPEELSKPGADSHPSAGRVAGVGMRCDERTRGRDETARRGSSGLMKRRRALAGCGGRTVVIQDPERDNPQIHTQVACNEFPRTIVQVPGW
jgi:hypothetical protein